MKAKFIVFIALLATASSQAATGFFGGFYFVTSYNGGSDIFNQVTTGTTPGPGASQGHDLNSDNINPQFTTFGTINLTDTLVLKGFEYKTFENDSSIVTHANLFYRIYPTGSPSGAFNQIQMTGPSSQNGGDKTWQVTSGTTNLLSGLSVGDYTIQIYTESYTNGTNTAGNIFGFTADSPTATFSIIPEPTTALLGGLGMLALLRRRRA